MKLSLHFPFIILLLLSASVYGQRPLPLDYFRSPLDIPLSVTGSFGEIRPNHFHSGADFKVQGKEGLPVFAVADGWVSRIKISPVGFGNALYIDHPNGFTSVYGHLFGYNDTITAYAHDLQYTRKSFEVDIFPINSHDTLWVKKGDLIGFAGNSGSSFGAHLHFELRNTATERIINPLLFGFECKDIFSPNIDFVKVYPANLNSSVKGCNLPAKFSIKRNVEGEYGLTVGDTLDAWGDLSFGVQAFDYLYSSGDRNGWYNIKMYFDKALFFSMQLDSFAFNETRFINASLDYGDSFLNGSRIIQSVKLPGNELSLHLTGKGNGIVTVKDGNLHEIVISAADISGKQAVLRFKVRSTRPHALVEIPSPLMPDTVILFPYLNENTFSSPDIIVQLPKGSLFDDTWFTYSCLPRRKGTFSKKHDLHQPETPLKGKMSVSIKADQLPVRLRSKALIARIDGDGQLHSAGGGFAKGFVSTETNLFDSYAIIADTIPPRIKLIKDRSKHKSSIKFTVSDNFSGIEKYSAEINGQWVLLQWDPKNDLMVYKYDEMIKPGKNIFKMVLIDKKGNKSSFSTILKK